MKRKPKPDYADIARLERELGIAGAKETEPRKTASFNKTDSATDAFSLEALPKEWLADAATNEPARMRPERVNVNDVADHLARIKTLNPRANRPAFASMPSAGATSSSSPGDSYYYGDW